ncbi:MAG: TylF/MycF family methyltransferase [Actinomycetota bacterium]|nr:TylF/MycF family methyltransferase [Actinomycetota bacterium]
MGPGVPGRPAELYLDLLQRCLTGSLDEEELRVVTPSGRVRRRAWSSARWLLERADLHLVRRVPVRPDIRSEGRDWPSSAQTMVGLRRLENLRRCIVEILSDGVPGDLLEAGTWRGGAAIFMRAALEAYGDRSRTVWVADSFQGVPPPDAERYPADAGETFHSWPELAVPLRQVKANFDKYGLLDDRVRFLEGWFKHTLPVAPVEHLALLRVDGDLYESTMDALRPLYPKVSPGGFVVIDDYGCVPACRQAVDEFRAENGIGEPMERIDWTGVFWRKDAGAANRSAGGP